MFVIAIMKIWKTRKRTFRTNYWFDITWIFVRMMEDTIEQMRQEMKSIDKKIEILEAEIKVIKSDPSNYYQ